ncbi:hypothetical protein ACOSQ2_019808 [Xanthoceras sorbifolium]
MEFLGGPVDSGVPDFSGGVLVGSAVWGEEVVSAAGGEVVGSGAAGSFLVGSLAVPCGLSFGMRREAGPAIVRSLGVLDAGRGVFDVAGCDGGLCVGEGRVLVPATGGTVPDPGSDRLLARCY